MGSRKGRVPRPSHAGSPMRLAGALLVLFAALVALLTACAPSAQDAANSSLSKLNSALQSASKQGVPARRLGTIIAQEDNFEASTATGSNSAYQAAATGYSNLYNQVVALEKLSPTKANALATDDLSSLQTTLATTENSRIANVATAAKQFAPSVPVAQQQLAAAKTTKEYFTVDEFILDQLAAITQMTPDYNQIQTLTALVNSLGAALGPGAPASHVLQCGTEGGEIGSFGIIPSEFWVAQNSYPVNSPTPVTVRPEAQSENYYFSTWPSQALNSFESATNANDFTVLGNTLAAQIATLTADSAPQTLARAKVAAAVDRFQTDVTTYQNDLQADNSFLASHRAKNKDVPDYGEVWGLSSASKGFAPPKDFYPNIPSFKLNPQYSKQASADNKALAAATTSSALAALTKTVQTQEKALSLSLLKVEAYYDTDITLQNLVKEGQSTTTNVTFSGVLYKTPNAYEYADDDLRFDKQDTVGIQDAMIRIDQAAYRESYIDTSDSLTDWQAIENEAQMFIHNLSAMITNLAQMPKNNAARIAWSMTAHQTDINLIDYYGLQNTKVIVVSLREQKARLYQNGKLVTGADGKPYAFDVTTGSPDKPSVPGLHCALPPLKGPPKGDIFKSADPPGSPFYYKPTPVHFSFGYSLYGYFMHDGWWRDATEMGYLTNLPHFDPEAFNGGSHGCINFHYRNGDMAKVYAFSYAGIPIIVY